MLKQMKSISSNKRKKHSVIKSSNKLLKQTFSISYEKFKNTFSNITHVKLQLTQAN